MKYIQRIFVVLFFCIILLPIFAFNFTEGAISEIDNRELAALPSIEDVADIDSYPTLIENYISDRIGFRDDIILQYALLNDKAFDLMVHPMYMYGKDGHVYTKRFAEKIPETDHYMAFAHLIKQMQEYCYERGVPFIFVFTPTKHSVVTEYIPDGINVSHDWVDQFIAELERLGVNYVDNTKTMLELYQQGECVFNKKYDSNHWSDLGAFYGTNAILSKLHEDMPAIIPNDMNDFDQETNIMESLLVSEFPINEEVLEIKSKHADDFMDFTYPMKDEIEHHPSYGYYIDLVNPNKPEDEFPRVMALHGSHYMGNSKLYFAEAFHEFIGIHNYENAVNFPYYYNIFKPDYVVFEFCEHTVFDTFKTEEMWNIEFSPTLEHACASMEYDVTDVLSSADIVVEEGEALTKIIWHNTVPVENAWLYCDAEDDEYDMIRTEDGYEATMRTEIYHKNNGQFSIVTKSLNTVTTYQMKESDPN